jgi:hypothetical protein
VSNGPLGKQQLFFSRPVARTFYGGASKRNVGLFLSRKVKSDAFLIQYLQFLDIENAEPKKKHSEIRGHIYTPPTNLPLSSMAYLTLRKHIVDHNADILVLWRGA